MKRRFHQRPYPHGAQVFGRRQIQHRLESRDLVRVRQFVHLAAADQVLENRARLACDDRADQRAVRKVGNLDFLDLHAQRLDHLECGPKRGLRGRLGPILEIDRHVADGDLGQPARRVLRRVVEAAPGRSGICRVHPGDLMQHQRAILRGSAHRPQFVESPRKRHRPGAADQIHRSGGGRSRRRTRTASESNPKSPSRSRTSPGLPRQPIPGRSTIRRSIACGPRDSIPDR